ncbi:MAG: ISAs1 family transposase [Chloroflexi bacterium]|nr:ISAs1 family transposase [Chloroflexota bacterium]
MRTFLALSKGLASYDTFGRVGAVLDPDQCQHSFLSWVRASATRLEGLTECRSHGRGVGKATLYLVSAWAAGDRLVLRQDAVADQSNEVTALPAPVRLLDLTGGIVTIDAMGCQTAIVDAIAERDGDDVLGLKGSSQGTLHQEVAAAFC